ncbi:L-type lectin-domain containing receptor kinase IV.1 [Selaginella moellendorffii]|uniref:L-type lectin-domain containing receptor kinase IV.1 n=1 Tax=Selaginella moellendorffii TaxID=88036 RepID=UPI000D1C8631|nr:L-type lectin-domain containing receptor kinase IV.1 [Selaginella moellendorffii]|eukprot:XP_002974870.2 L-type lectin-domain containing receptor kinase IV.1 [Selaginella moellendorffii]
MIGLAVSTTHEFALLALVGPMAKALAIVLSIVALGATAALDDHVSFTYSNFSPQARNDFVATGDATFNNDELRLTGNRLSSYGRIMKQQEIQLCNASAGAGASFSTEFVFAITKNDSTLVNADGLAFTIAPNLVPTSSAGYGRWLGLFDPAANGRASNRIVAVEFDTFMNFPPVYPEFQDIDDNHVGLDINGILSVNSSSLYPRRISLGIGTVAARIDYDAAVQRLRVFVSSDPSFRNLGDPVLEHSVNLCAYVSDVSYVGFSAGSGTANLDFHRILSWNFSSRLERIPPPSPVTVVDGGNSPPAPEHNLLGTGGFGKVYRGILPGENSPVAIKKMVRDSHQGEREFLAELQIISKRSHPAALIYLHEDWEQQVIHRDVKCSNVMLDEEFRARLGDVGLARTASHDVSSRTTTLAGTLGYIAPEVGVTYKFTPASDVYSYGVVTLEVVTGRRVIGSSKEKDHNAWLLVPWVEEQYAAGKLLGVVDPRL